MVSKEQIFTKLDQNDKQGAINLTYRLMRDRQLDREFIYAAESNIAMIRHNNEALREFIDGFFIETGAHVSRTDGESDENLPAC